ncbi:MAG: hypothetical protein H0V29_02235 [Thermoleophilaceae bacterium]|nr:hypothetical protein [Thermoleophilaceae bacterium]
MEAARRIKRIGQPEQVVPAVVEDEQARRILHGPFAMNEAHAARENTLAV